MASNARNPGGTIIWRGGGSFRISGWILQWKLRRGRVFHSWFSVKAQNTPGWPEWQGSTVTFLGEVSSQELSRAFAASRAFLFPGVEDFGILPIEAQAAGLPVLALAEGGALETVIDGETGLFFNTPGVDTLLDGLDRLEARDWAPDHCRKNANRFSRTRFEEDFSSFLIEKVL